MTTKIGTAGNYIELLKELGAFLTTAGHAWGARFTGAGNGRLRGPGGTTGGYIGTAASVTETITLTAISATSFSVFGTISGNLGTATVGTDFAGTVLRLRIVAGSVPFAVGDKFTINTTPKWQALRFSGCIESTYRTSSYNNFQALFNDNTSVQVTANALPQFVQIDMVAPTKVRAISIWSGDQTVTAPREFNLQWSDNGVDWTTAQSWTAQTWFNTQLRRDFVLAADAGAHLYWKLNVTGTASLNNTTAMSEMRMFADPDMKMDVTSRAEFAWQAPGVDGAQQIFVAGFTSTDTGADTYNVAFRGFRFWQDRAQSIVDVPDNSGSKYLYLAKLPIAYWMVVNGGRLILITRISGVMQFAYVGFGLPYETPDVHPFPYLVGASHVSQTLKWDNTADMLRFPCDPMFSTGGATTPQQCGLAAIFPSGTFEGIGNRYASSSSAEGSYNDAIPLGTTWPYSIGTYGQAQPTNIRDNLDGSKPLLPVVLNYGRREPRHVWGEFDGVYFTTGFNQAAEVLIQDGAIDLMTVQNVFRTTLNSYCAIALD